MYLNRRCSAPPGSKCNKNLFILQILTSLPLNACRDDDDINDVATMGGVNLTEESRNILATSSDLMAGQMRSCKEEAFLSSSALVTRLSGIG